MATAKKKAPAEPKIPRQIKSKMVKEKICAAATDLIKSNGYEYVTSATSATQQRSPSEASITTSRIRTICSAITSPQRLKTMPRSLRI